jgi:hypothetical protein
MVLNKNPLAEHQEYENERVGLGCGESGRQARITAQSRQALGYIAMREGEVRPRHQSA